MCSVTSVLLFTALPLPGGSGQSYEAPTAGSERELELLPSRIFCSLAFGKMAADLPTGGICRFSTIFNHFPLPGFDILSSSPWNNLSAL